MISNTPGSPYLEDTQYSGYIEEPSSWENFLQFSDSPAGNFTSPHSPAPLSEILFEKPPSSPCGMDIENDEGDFDKDALFKNFIEDFEISEDAVIKKSDAPRVHIEADNDIQENERSECSRCHSDEDELEDVGSISTKDTHFEFSNLDDDAESCRWDDNLSTFSEAAYDIEADFRTRAGTFIEGRPREERDYIMKIMPMIVTSLRERYTHDSVPLTDEIVRTILKELLYGKEITMGAERQMMREMVEKDIKGMRELRPRDMITDDDLMVHKRKGKKAAKGNRNSSNLNHMNENYVSNIFQFAKRSYPEDREIQKIGNERNVSASSFRSMMTARLTDDIMMRKAKARVQGVGRELIGNIEYWMRDGYFEQCADREKYIWHKEKALRDLALAGQY